MANSNDNLAPVIIKKVKKVEGGHHGGAWKVAYADFVTAMMAFFLLLWLLATTTPQQRSGIAEYFTPTVGLKDSKGIGFDGGLTPNEEGSSRTTLSDPGLVTAQLKHQTDNSIQSSPDDPAMELEEVETSTQQAAEEKVELESSSSDEREHERQMKETKRVIEEIFQNSAELQQLRKNLIIQETPEGLKMDVVDDEKTPMFLEGTATMTDKGRLMFKALSGVITRTENKVSIVGHTRKKTYPPGAVYTSWELTADRSNATRRYLTENLTEPDRFEVVSGMSDQELLLPKEPQSVRNRRISLTLLRNSLISQDGAASTLPGLLSTPEVEAEQIKQPVPEPPPVEEAPVEEEAPPSPIFNPEIEKSGDQGFVPVEDAISSTGSKSVSGPLSVPEVDSDKIVKPAEVYVAPEEETQKEATPAPKPTGPTIFDPDLNKSGDKGFMLREGAINSSSGAGISGPLSAPKTDTEALKSAGQDEVQPVADQLSSPSMYGEP